MENLDRGMAFSQRKNHDLKNILNGNDRHRLAKVAAFRPKYKLKVTAKLAHANVMKHSFDGQLVEF